MKLIVLNKAVLQKFDPKLHRRLRRHEMFLYLEKYHSIALDGRCILIGNDITINFRYLANRINVFILIMVK